jgi:predicted nucleic acid-binding protein
VADSSYKGSIATLCLQHSVAELWTNDRDFARFRGLKIVNPLVEA